MKFKQIMTVGTVVLGTLAIAAGQPGTAQAKTKAHVIKTRTMKRAAYKVNKGYLYKSTSLTKKAASAAKHPKMTFYSYKSATIKKQNGKKAVFYYLKNKSGAVKGWIWRGDVTKQPTYAQQKKNITAVRTIIHGMSQDVQDRTLGYFAHMNYKVAYHDGASGRDLSHVIDIISETARASHPEDVKGTQKLYNLFKNQIDKEYYNEYLKNYWNNFDDARAGRSNAPVNLLDGMGILLEAISTGVGRMAN